MDINQTPAPEATGLRLTAYEFDLTLAKVEAINERAAKKGFTGRITLTGVPFERTERDEIGIERTTQMVLATLGGAAPSYGGWKFVATLDWDENADALIVRKAPGTDDVVVDRGALVKGGCDHCGVDRNRRNTYLVISEETGEMKQVGSTCVKDFTGWQGRFVFISEQDVTDEFDGYGFGGDTSVDTLYLLAVAYATTRAFGYVKANDWDKTPTKRVVDDIINGRSRFDAEKRAAIAPFAEEAAAKALEIRAFILSDAFAGDSDYVINLKAMLSAPYVSHRNIGYVVSAPQAYARSQAQTLIREREAKFGAGSEFVGAVKDRIVVTGTIGDIRYLDGYMGDVVTLYTLHGKDGNVYVWFASRSDVLGTEVGVPFAVKGTVKAHKEFRGQKQTTLTRCALIKGQTAA